MYTCVHIFVILLGVVLRGDFGLDCRNDVIAPPSDITWPCEDPRRLRDLLEFRTTEYVTSDTVYGVDDANRNHDGGCVIV